MKLRHRIVLYVFAAIVVVLTLASSASAQQITATSKAKGDYLGADGAIFYDGAVLQSDLSLSWKSGLFAGIWTSTAANTALEFDKEVDMFVGYGSKVGRLKYTLDAVYFVVQGIDVANANLELGLGPTFVRVEGYTPVQSGGPRKGLIFATGVRQDFQVAERIVLNAAGLLKHDSGAFGFDRGWLAQGYTGLSVEIVKKTSLVGGARWSTPLSKMTDGRKTEIVWELGVSRSFR